jgi:hypothetical protein
MILLEVGPIDILLIIVAFTLLKILAFISLAPSNTIRSIENFKVIEF